MAAQQELISAVRSMQANAQANLPVIPNNGNPNGAYNAPRRIPQMLAGKASPNEFSWLEPSPAMQQLQSSMAQRQQYLDNRINQIRQQPSLTVDSPSPIQTQPIQPLPTIPHMPSPAILPIRNNSIALPVAAINANTIPTDVRQIGGALLPQPRMI